MPTWAWLGRFRTDFERLTPTQQVAFLAALEQFVEDMERGHGFRKGLRVRGVEGAPGLFEMTWDADGVATFEYGDAMIEGEPHVVWRRLGTHPFLT